VNFDELLKKRMNQVAKLLSDNREVVEAYRMGFEDGVKAAQELPHNAKLKPQPTGEVKMIRHNDEWEHLYNLLKAENEAQAAEIEKLREQSDFHVKSAHDALYAVIALSDERDRLKAENIALKGNLGHAVPSDVQLPEVEKNVLADFIARDRDLWKSKCEIYEKALQFYSDGDHFVDHGGTNYTPDGSCCPHYAEAENPSGEPVNYLEGHGDYGLEDGSIARQAILTASKIGEGSK
jgi:hypothetical protein